jgi:hypothetical protein
MTADKIIWKKRDFRILKNGYILIFLNSEPPHHSFGVPIGFYPVSNSHPIGYF